METKATDYEKVFRAAAEGYLRPWAYILKPPVHATAWSSPSYNGEELRKAECMAGAFNAIADVFAGIAKIEHQTQTKEK